MSDSDRLILETIILQEQKTNAPKSPVDKYFEYFSAEQIMKELGHDLDPEQISSGIVGNGDSISVCFDAVTSLYNKLGASDQVAKGTTFIDSLKGKLAHWFQSGERARH